MEEMEWKSLSEEQNYSIHCVLCWYKEVRFAKVEEIKQENWKI
jgi:hypothetical protein